MAAIQQFTCDKPPWRGSQPDGKSQRGQRRIRAASNSIPTVLLSVPRHAQHPTSPVCISGPSRGEGGPSGSACGHFDNPPSFPRASRTAEQRAARGNARGDTTERATHKREPSSAAGANARADSQFTVVEANAGLWALQRAPVPHPWIDLEGGPVACHVERRQHPKRPLPDG